MFYKARSINPLEYFQHSTAMVRAVSFMLSAMLIFFVFATPTFAAGVEAVKAKNLAYAQESTKRQSKNINKAVEILEIIEDKKRTKEEKKELAKALRTLKKEIRDEEKYADEDFEKMFADIKAKKLPALFQERVVKMQEKYTQRKDKLHKVIDNVAARYADDEAIAPYDVKDVNLSEFRSNKQQLFDPDTLKNDPTKPNPQNKPKVNKSEFALSGLYDTPRVRVAALGDFQFDTLANASNPTYLSQNDEVKITQMIKDKAAELDYDPVQIYNFVRNNIEYVPTWGAAQSAELTLGAKRGNAMDISSLLIALLRASKIPARYVHGTIDVEADRLKNWMGEFESFYAAADYASRGGIPIFTYPSEAGQVRKVQMEHVWVEAAIDYFPSRGSKNLKADSWVPLDASFKQYEYSDGIDMQSIAGIDINGTVDSFLNSGEINATGGYATGFDPQALEDTLIQAQTNIKTYIDNNFDANTTTVYDVVGGKKIIDESASTLPSSLPNPLVVSGARYDKLPSSLQQRMEFYIRGLSQEFTIEELYNGIKTVTLPVSRINNEKVTISFAPATQEDEDALNTLLPEGEITDESQLPSTIPSYIHVKPQLKLNGEVIQELGETALGETYTLKQTLYKPTQTFPFAQPREMISGGYYAVNTIVQSVSAEKLRALQEKIKETQNILASNDQTQLSALTREDIMGDMVYAATLSYYAQMIAQGKMATRPLKTNFEVVGSSGIIGYKPKIAKRFGLPTGITAGGMSCDIVDAHMADQSSGDQDIVIQANQQLGMIGSSLEHLVLEQLFAQNGEQGFSAVKAIQLASQEGQKIFTITKDNYQEIMPKLQLAAAAEADIQAAAQAGLIVTTHERRISVNGYTGEGYIILNDRGTGAWMINGGMYGGGLALIIGGTALLWVSLAFYSFPGGLLYSEMVVAVALAGAALIAAGGFLLSGNKGACFISAQLALMTINRALLGRLGAAAESYLLPLLGIELTAGAWELCQCGEPPYCLDPYVP